MMQAKKALTLFPTVPAFVFELDILNAAFFVNKRIQNPTDDANQKRTQNGRPKPMNRKSGDNTRGHFDHDGVDNKGKQTKAYYIDWQCQDDCDRSEKGIQNSQDSGRKNGREKATDDNAFYQIRSY